MLFERIPVHLQQDSSECGPTTLRIVAEYFGRKVSIQEIVQNTRTSKDGISLLTLSKLADRMGFRSRPVRASWELLRQAPLPFVAHWSQRHFVVVFKITKKRVVVVDPAIGKVVYSLAEFIEGWSGGTENEGVLMLLEPTEQLYSYQAARKQVTQARFLRTYLTHYKKHYSSLIIGMILVGILSIGFPVLTSILIDFGVSGGNLQLIILILLAQLMLFMGRSAAEFIRTWTLLYIGSRTSISMESDFLARLLRQPISFFESRVVGDILQRLDDHRRVENFLTHGALNTVFSIVVFVMYGVVLAVYSPTVTAVFIVGTAVSILWVVIFMRSQRECDQRLFRQIADNQEAVVQMHHGIQDLKIMMATTKKRWDWEQARAVQFRLTVKQQQIRHLQSGGMMFLNEIKNILAVFFAASAVLSSEMTVGMMLAVSYVVGQLNGPMTQLTWALQTSQEARTSIDRIRGFGTSGEDDGSRGTSAEVPVQGDITVSEVSFSYDDDGRSMTIQDFSCVFPTGKVTALVGSSGSGKSTMFKLILKLYEPRGGSIAIGSIPLSQINSAYLYRSTTAVMQDSYLFPVSFASNIALNESVIDYDRVAHVASLACCSEFIEATPYRYDTKLGANGQGLSQGQKQRILIARALYRRPNYLFLDEATNSIDAALEDLIIQNIRAEIPGCTIVIIAHRLSIIRKADKIVVIRDGKVTDQGTHDELMGQSQVYYNLIEDQLVSRDEATTR